MTAQRPNVVSLKEPCTTLLEHAQVTGEIDTELAGAASPVTATTGLELRCGIDTASVAWAGICLPRAIARRLAEGPERTVGGWTFRPTFGGNLRMIEEPGGLVYGLHQSGERPATLWVEGRVSQVDGELATPEQLVRMAEVTEAVWRDAGFDPAGQMFPRVRRLDLATDVLMPGLGRSHLLADLPHVALSPFERKRVWYNSYASGEHVSGVDVLRMRGRKLDVQWRAYCRSTLLAPPRVTLDRPGEWTRIEVQKRWSGSDRPLLRDALTPSVLAEMWTSPFEVSLRPSHTTSEAISTALAALDCGDLDRQTTQRLIGHLSVDGVSLQAASASTVARYKALLVKLGVDRVSNAPGLSTETRELIKTATARWRRMKPSLGAVVVEMDEVDLFI